MSTSTIIQDYVGRGTFASRPATPSVPAGALAFYFATDTVVLYMWTGAAWVVVGSGTGSAGAGSVSPIGLAFDPDEPQEPMMIPGPSGAAAASAGPAFHPGFVAGQFYTSSLLNTISTFVLAVNTIYAMPFYVPVATTFTKASVRVSTLDAGKLVEIGIYSNVNGSPTTLEFDCGNVSTSATGQIEITALSLALAAGWHWLVVATNSAGVAALFSTGSTDAITSSLLGFNPVNVVTSGITAPWTFSAGALPGAFPAITYVTNQKMPLAFLRL